MTELAHYWRECDSVVVRGDEVRRRLVCGHVQVKALEYLNDTAKANPQVLVGKFFPCTECERPARERYAPKESR